MSLPETCPTCLRAERNSPASIRRSLEHDVETWQAEAARLGDAAAALAAENKGLAARVADLEARCKRLEDAGDAMLSAWLMPEDSMSYSDWVCLSSDAKSGWYAAKEAKP